MTTETSAKCPECGQTHNLLEGRLPAHHPNGLRCPMSDHVPTDWHDDGVHRAPAPAGPPEPPAPGSLGKQRRPRSDAGSKRATRQADAAADAEADRINAAMDKAKGDVLRPRAEPRAKRSRKSYHVALGEVQSFSTEKEALAAVGEAVVTWQGRITMFVGRIQPTKTVTVPASTTTTKVRERRGQL